MPGFRKWKKIHIFLEYLKSVSRTPGVFLEVKVQLTLQGTVLLIIYLFISLISLDMCLKVSLIILYLESLFKHLSSRYNPRPLTQNPTYSPKIRF